MNPASQGGRIIGIMRILGIIRGNLAVQETAESWELCHASNETVRVLCVLDGITFSLTIDIPVDTHRHTREHSR